MPITVLMILLSSRSAPLAQRIGARFQMTVGPLVIAAGLLLFTRIAPGNGYVATVLPAVIVFGLGLSCTVAPLTATVLASVDDAELGVASGVNNAASRLAGLLAVAVLPVARAPRHDACAGCAHGTGRGRAADLRGAVGDRRRHRVVHRRVRGRGKAARPADLLLPCYDPCRSDPASAA